MQRTVPISAVVLLAVALAAAPALAEDLPVDLELVLAVDVSQSVDAREGWLQRQGYVQALSHPRVIEAIRHGAYGRIAVTYFEWAGPGLWRTIVDWRVIDSPDTASAVAQILDDVPIARGTGTSITSAITHAAGLFDGSGVVGTRRVIDISGDGPNSTGGIVTFARDAVVASGITVNGVAINNFDGSNFTLPDLDVYYEECVIGGAGAFVVAAEGFESFAEAILKKLILEIAGAEPESRGRFAAVAGVIQAQARASKYAPACDIGERMRLLDNPALGREPLR